MRICDFGCGKKAKYLFKSGKWCCSESHNSCEVMKRKNSDVNMGRIVSEETRRKISESCKGKIPWNKGKFGFLKHNKKLKK